MAGYIRQSSFIDGDTITAALFNNEYNQLVNAFSNTSGHKHDGTTAEGPVIGLIGDAGETSPNNKVLIDTTNNHIEFYVEVSSNPVQQIYIADGAIVPVTDNDIDLGTSSLEFKDIYIDGTATIDTLTVDEAATVGTTLGVTGATTLSSTLGVTGATTLSSTLAVTGATTLSSTLAVTGTSTLTGNITATNDLSVGGNLTVTGNATISGNLTFGDADTDSINLAAEIDSNIVPNTDDTYDLGTSTKQWRNLYIDGTAEIDTLAIDGTTVTSTAAELNILDGVTSTAAELNILDGVTSTTAELNILDGVTSTTAELNILDGVTSTATEINIVDGDTAATSTTLADADRVVVNDNGTMVQVALTDFETYFEGALDTLSNVTTVGALNAGSITSGFGSIDNGSSAITTTGTVTYGSLSDGTITITAFVDEDDMSSDSATLVPTQQSVKAYVDSQVTAQDLDFQGDSGGALSIDLDSETLTIAGGTGIDTTGATNTLTVAIDSTVATLTGTQTLTNKTLTSPVLNTGVSGTAILDEDNMASDSATQLATQQSIKAYVDTEVGAIVTDVVSDTTPQLGGDLASNGNDILFADNDKAIFGAGSDLQIYHDGSNSYIRDAGDGDLNLRGDAYVRIQSQTSGTSLAHFRADAEVALYYNNSKKLETTSTGIDVTGSVVADGATISSGSSGATASGNADELILEGSGNTGLSILSGATSLGNLFFADSGDAADGYIQYDQNSRSMRLGTATQERMRINSSGNVGIGTTAPQSKLETNLHSGSDSSLMNANTVNDVHLIRAGFGQNAATTSNAGAKWGLRFVGRNDGTYDNGKSGAIFAVSEDTAGYNREVGLAFHTSSFDAVHAEKMRIDGSGNVGIGTDSPSSDLETLGSTGIKTGNGSGTGIFKADGGSTKVGSFSNHRFDLVTNNTTKASIDTSGNVGIGETSPLGKLHVKTADSGASVNASGNQLVIENSGSAGLTILSGTTGDSNIFLGDSGNNVAGILQYSHNGDSFRISSTGQLLLQTGGANTKLAIDSSGNVGIGTTSPNYKLHLHDSSQNSYVYMSGGGSLGESYGGFVRGYGVSGSGGNLDLGVHDAGGTGFRTAINVQPQGNAVIFNTAGSERMRINSSGNVGIGTSSPTEKLTVNGAILASGALQDDRTSTAAIDFTSNVTRFVSYGASGVGGQFAFRTAGGGASSAEKVRINYDGNVGIGTTSPVKELQIGSATAGVDANMFLAAGSNAYSRLYMGDATTGTGLYAGLLMYDHGNDAMTMFTSSTERMRIDDEGHVGINMTPSPVGNDKVLSIYESNTPRIKLHNATTGTAGTDGAELNMTGNDFILENRESGNVRFFNNGSERMRLDNTGRLLVNKTSSALQTDPTAKIVTGGASASTETTMIHFDDMGQRGTGTAQTIDFSMGRTNVTPDAAKAQIAVIAEASSATSASHFLGYELRTAAGDIQEVPFKIQANGGQVKFNTTEQPQSGNPRTGQAIVIGPSTQGAVTGGLTSATVLQNRSGELYAVDSSHNNTQLTPHNWTLISDGPSEELAWTYWSQRPNPDNPDQLQGINVDMAKVARKVEDLVGEKLVYTENSNMDDHTHQNIIADIQSTLADLTTRIEALEG